jgi:predicted TIM-barrel fold metal-dependent hydrolase
MGKARDVAKKFPNTPLILDHAGFPRSRSDEYFRDWCKGLARMAEAENTWCKISGLAMFDHRWTVESWRPWVMACVETFGVERCFFGTNWPLDRLFSSYDSVVNAYEELVADFSDDERELLFFKNATSVYGLD